MQYPQRREPGPVSFLEEEWNIVEDDHLHMTSPDAMREPAITVSAGELRTDLDNQVRETHIFPRTMGSFFGISFSITPVSSSQGYCSEMEAVGQNRRF